MLVTHRTGFVVSFVVEYFIDLYDQRLWFQILCQSNVCVVKDYRNDIT